MNATAATPANRTPADWRLRTRTLALGTRTLVMGVVNITPDSFSDGGRFLSVDTAVARALQLLDEGADIIDLGAESTRPGSQAGGAEPAVSTDQEQARLLPVLEALLKEQPESVVSVDTYKHETAQAALQAGAEIINDVSGLLWDPQMASACAQFRAAVVLTHTRGRPEQWRTQPQLPPGPLVDLVRAGLSASLAAATSAGIASESIVLDPGYGFGKRFEENYALLARQASLLELGRPLLAGLSRKSFLGHTLAKLRGEPHSQSLPSVSVEERENASLAAMTAAILNGTSVVRVHAVRAAVEAAHIADAILEAQNPPIHEPPPKIRRKKSRPPASPTDA